MNNERSRLQEIKDRIQEMRKLEESLLASNLGTYQADAIIRKQTAIQENYYGDVMELLETMENVEYQLTSLEPSLEMPVRGYVRNCFNAIIRTLKEGF